jgi:hypothetical protein
MAASLAALGLLSLGLIGLREMKPAHESIVAD